MMICKKRCAFFAVFVVIFTAYSASVLGAVDTVAIDEVRNKDVLGEQDLQIIDDFLASATAEMLTTQEISDIVSARVAVVSRRKNNQKGAENQYAENLIMLAKKHLKSALAQAAAAEKSEPRRDIILVNLLILVDNLESAGLAELAFEVLGDDNTIVRYWAVHCVTNPAVIAELNSADVRNSDLGKRITQQLLGRVDKESSPEVISLFVDFASAMQGANIRDMLVKIADARIKKYADWSVNYELLDSAVLKALGDKIIELTVGSEEKKALANRFAQLYSYVMQRYIKGQDVLNKESKQQLVSVLVEVEQSLLPKLLGVRQATIKNALEKNKISTLIAEYESLFGTEQNVGRLPQALNFDYDGNKGPRQLAEPTKETK